MKKQNRLLQQQILLLLTAAILILAWQVGRLVPPHPDTTYTPLPTLTPYPTQPTLTPYSPQPSYTPNPTYTLLPTQTSYPPDPTYTPLASLTLAPGFDLSSTTPISVEMPTLPTSACTGGERVIAPFAAGIEAVQSEDSYEGLTLLTVSGIGQAAGSQASDAFYVLTDNGPQYLAGWVLRINGILASDLIPGHGTPSYNSDHIYTFYIRAPGGNLTFGVSDLSTGDNTGSYTIVICKVQGDQR